MIFILKINEVLIMLIVNCINKYRDKNNNIIGYRLQDKNGNEQDIKSNQLKQAIRDKRVEVKNLTLTSDNRLVDTTPEQIPGLSETEKLKALIQQWKKDGIVIEVPTYCGHKCYVISLSASKHIIYIPDDVTYLNKDIHNQTFTKYIKDLSGHIRVIGGKGLKSTRDMFNNCNIETIDLTKLNTKNVVDMRSMFFMCKARAIEFNAHYSDFSTQNVKHMTGMFCYCNAEILKLNGFDTRNVKDMSVMFCGCHARSIDLSSFSTKNVINMDGMFWGCKTRVLDLVMFDTSRVENMYHMFAECETEILDLSSFKTENTLNMSGMFENCKATYIDLKSFNVSINADIRSIFNNCKSEIRTADPLLAERIH